MKKFLVLCLIAAISLCSLSGCGEKLPPHEHTWSEATYDAASTCAECGETQGEPLVPDFVKYGITTPLKVGGTYDYNATGADLKTPVSAKATVLSYELTDSVGILTPIDDYVCHVVKFEVVFDRAGYQAHGVQLNRSYTNYYDIAFLDNNAAVDEETGKNHSIVMFNGKEAAVYIDAKNEFVETPDGGITSYIELYVQAPIGYDGMVCGLANPAAQIPEGGNISDVFTEKDYLLFRLDGKIN